MKLLRVILVQSYLERSTLPMYLTSTMLATAVADAVASSSAKDRAVSLIIIYSAECFLYDGNRANSNAAIYPEACTVGATCVHAYAR